MSDVHGGFGVRYDGTVTRFDFSLPPDAKAYLVGGAVRDTLLGLPVKDRDYVVVGTTQQAMLECGFNVVGADFPVFLHPVTAEEYALARTERKTGKGYGGFVAHAAPDVTLEQDLARRDFTINAIAQDVTSGELTDPFHGVRDLDSRVLRHVSPAFAEDPLRILRAARFMARFAPLGFQVADETVTLMREMVASGELEHLVPERVFTELRKALGAKRPDAFLQTMRRCDALRVVLPEVDALYGVPQKAQWHPEIDTGVHVEMVMQQAARLAPGDELIGYCALTHDLGKALTPSHILPGHRGHEDAGLEPLAVVNERLRVPSEYAQLAALVVKEHLNMHRIPEMRPATVLRLLKRLDAFRKPGRVRQFVLACEADSRGRLGMEDRDYPQGPWLLEAFRVAQDITAKDVAPELTGPAVGEAIDRVRVQAIAALPPCPNSEPHHPLDPTNP